MKYLMRKKIFVQIYFDRKSTRTVYLTVCDQSFYFIVQLYIDHLHSTFTQKQSYERIKRSIVKNHLKYFLYDSTFLYDDEYFDLKSLKLIFNTLLLHRQQFIRYLHHYLLH